MATEIYRTSALPGASVSVFHQAGDKDVLLTIATHGSAHSLMNIYLGADDLERLAADILAAAQAVQMPRRAA